MKLIRYRIEGVLCATLFFVFRLMPLDMASGTGGFLARVIGPKLAASRKADRNLKLAFPDMNTPRRREMIRSMWDNLGRVFAEYPHIQTIAKERITVENEDFLKNLATNPKGAIFIGAHHGNWEICAVMALLRYNTLVNITYRPPNNPYVDRIINRYRSVGGRIEAFPKSIEGGRKMMNCLKNKGRVAILIDQKYNEGLPVRFFGRYAMTNPIGAQLALRYDVPLVPFECYRTGGAHFKLILHPPLPVKDPDNNLPLSVEKIMESANLTLESYIRAHPEQWIWMHKRWDSKQAKALEAQELAAKNKQ